MITIDVKIRLSDKFWHQIVIIFFNFIILSIILEPNLNTEVPMGPLHILSRAAGKWLWFGAVVTQGAEVAAQKSTNRSSKRCLA